MTLKHVLLMGAAIALIVALGFDRGDSHGRPDGFTDRHGTVIGPTSTPAPRRAAAFPTGIEREDRRLHLPRRCARTVAGVADVLLDAGKGRASAQDRAVLARSTSASLARLLTRPPRTRARAQRRRARRGALEPLDVTPTLAVVAVTVHRGRSVSAVILTVRRRGRRWRVTAID